jgi:DNA-binding MarR family transcriptional regulator
VQTLHTSQNLVIGTLMSSKARARITKRQYESLSNFRYELRRYLRYSEEITRQNGITPLQYQLLLHVKGFPDRDYATVTELAERLQAHHHGVVALVTRCEQAGLVEREVGEEDRRVVFIHLTGKGERVLERLAELHRRELLQVQQKFLVPESDES